MFGISAFELWFFWKLRVASRGAQASNPKIWKAGLGIARGKLNHLKRRAAQMPRSFFVVSAPTAAPPAPMAHLSKGVALEHQPLGHGLKNMSVVLPAHIDWEAKP